VEPIHERIISEAESAEAVRFVGVEADVMLEDGAADGERSRTDAELGEEEDAEAVDVGLVGERESVDETAGAPGWIGVEVGAGVEVVLGDKFGVEVEVEDEVADGLTTVAVDEAAGVLDGESCTELVAGEEGVAPEEDAALDEEDGARDIGLGDDGGDGDDDG
jgi:hypothetical protein